MGRGRWNRWTELVLHPEVEVAAQARVFPRGLLVLRLFLNRATNFLENLLNWPVGGLHCLNQCSGVGAVPAFSIGSDAARGR